ncbi:MAG: YcaO-like family protein [Kofleriaceae bacterium]
MALQLDGHRLDAKPVIRDGTFRSAALATTWRRFAPLTKRAGITRIADLTGLDVIGIPVFAAIRPMGRSLSTQQGKGITAEAARVSALMESLETWTAENVTLPTITASFRKLKPRAVDVRTLARPRGRLDLDATWRWVEGRDVVTDQPVLVPLETVTLDTTFRRPPVFDISSNGLASGNQLVEAVLHGLCELIERDAEAVWRRTGGDRRIVLDSIADATCRGLIDRVIAAGARLFLWDLGGMVPSIGCAIMEDPREPAWRALGIYEGFGAHPVPAIAAARAITEAAQTRLTYIAGARDDFFPFDYERTTDRDVLLPVWERLTSACDDPVGFDDITASGGRSLGEQLERVVELLCANGYRQIIAVDLTHPVLGVPVVKTIVPRLATDIEVMG